MHRGRGGGSGAYRPMSGASAHRGAHHGMAVGRGRPLAYMHRGGYSSSPAVPVHRGASMQRDHSHVQCYNCGQYGHTSHVCHPSPAAHRAHQAHMASTTATVHAGTDSDAAVELYHGTGAASWEENGHGHMHIGMSSTPILDRCMRSRMHMCSTS